MGVKRIHNARSAESGKMKRRIPAAVAALAFPFLASSVSAYESADSVRCGGNLITVGDPVERLLESCGQPLRRDGNLWYYQEGSGSFVKAIGVGDGKVLFIRVQEK